jgi:hypothetical protein
MPVKGFPLPLLHACNAIAASRKLLLIRNRPPRYQWCWCDLVDSDRVNSIHQCTVERSKSPPSFRGARHPLWLSQGATSRAIFILSPSAAFLYVKCLSPSLSLKKYSDRLCLACHLLWSSRKSFVISRIHSMYCRASI